MICDSCHSSLIKDSLGFFVCSNCGLQSPEPPYYTNEFPKTKDPTFDFHIAVNENTSRNTMPLFASFNGNRYKYQGMKISVHQAKFLETSIYQKKETYAKVTLDGVCKRLELPIHIYNRAYYLLSQFNEPTIGRALRLRYSVACLWIAIKEANYPISMNHIIKGYGDYRFPVSPSMIIKDCQKIRLVSKISLQTNITRVISYMNGYFESLLSEPHIKDRMSHMDTQCLGHYLSLMRKGIQYISSQIIDNRIVYRIQGYKPTTIAASLLYSLNIAISETHRLKPIFTQQIVSEKFGLSEYQIQHANKFIVRIIMDKILVRAIIS